MSGLVVPILGLPTCKRQEQAMLTDVKLRALVAHPPTTRIEIPDGTVPGLIVRIGPRAQPVWTLRFAVKGAGGTTDRGKKLSGRKFMRMSLGTYPAITLREARAKAAEVLADADLGISPAHHFAFQAQVDRDASYTLDMLADAFMSGHVEPNLKSAYNARWIFRDFIRPTWGGRAPEGLTKKEVTKELDRILRTSSRSAALQTLKWMSSMYNWGVDTGRLDWNPLHGIKGPAQFKSRERVLNLEEIRAVWKVAERLDYPSGPLIHLLLLTGCRLREISCARASWLDRDNRALSVPGTSYKTGDPTIIALVPQAMAIFDAMPRPSAGDYLLSTTLGERPLYTVTPLALRRLKEESQAVLGRSMEHWTIHDLRRSVATHLARLGVDEVLIERVLGHRISGVRAVYNRYRYLEEKRAALALWAKELLPGVPPRGEEKPKPANDDTPSHRKQHLPNSSGHGSTAPSNHRPA